MLSSPSHWQKKKKKQVIGRNYQTDQKMQVIDQNMQAIYKKCLPVAKKKCKPSIRACMPSTIWKQ